MKESDDFMENLRAIRLERGLSLRQVQQKVGIFYSVLSKYETGRCKVSTEDLVKLADLYQTSVDYLLDRTEVKIPYPKKKSCIL